MRRGARASPRAVAAALAALVLLCPGASAGLYRSFANPRPVTIRGYSGSAMEPFISSDGSYLLFNTSNVAPNIPALQYATRIDAQTFEYAGEVLGANEPGVLSGTPSMDLEGNLYFVSPRSYAQTLATVYAGTFSAGTVSALHLVSGVAGTAPGVVDFDASVSADGSSLYVSVGHFEAGKGPTSASLTLFDRLGNSFVADPHSARILRNVNRAGQLDYAACVSANGLELFFTRAIPGSSSPPAIYRAARASTSLPFSQVQRVAAITGFAEAPSLSADGSTLYYHELVGAGFQIEMVTRP